MKSDVRPFQSARLHSKKFFAVALKEVVALAVVLLCLFVFTRLMSYLGRFLDRNKGPGEVTFNERLVQYAPRGGDVRCVLWDELLEVGVLTTDAGPVADDVFWMLVDGPEKGCLIPSETVGMGELLKRLQTLPDFDNEAVVSAMGSSENAKFVCWVKPLRSNPSFKRTPNGAA